MIPVELLQSSSSMSGIYVTAEHEGQDHRLGDQAPYQTDAGLELQPSSKLKHAA